MQLKATPSNLARVFGAARTGDTILLSPGDYGTFRGGEKPGTVTLRPVQGARVLMNLAFNPASNITIDGLTVTGADLSHPRTKNITVRNSDIPGQVIFRTGYLQNANILFDHNVHRDWDKCDSCGEGRVWLPGQTSQPSGIAIQNSDFRGGLSDGIQNGSRGTRILNNRFHDIESGTASGVHADAIQLYGSAQTVIKGNYFYDLPHGVGNVMAPDGADHELIEDDVFSPIPPSSGEHTRPFAIDLYSDKGSVVRHNTLADGRCEFDAPCGTLRLGSKDGAPAGRGTVITDNVLGQISVGGNGPASFAKRAYNLVRTAGGGAGHAEIQGLPSYVGGAHPKSYAGFALSSRSLGRRNASDGLDRGARIHRKGPIGGHRD